MHFKGLDLNLLVVLDALLDEQSVSRAADRLNVSQPAVSAALSKLRWHLDDEILQKIGRQLTLTPRAKSLSQPLKDILMQVESTILNDLEFDANSFSREFKISMTSYSSQVILPKLMPRLSTLYPRIRCDIVDIAFDTITRIKNGDIDLCVTFLQTKLLNPKESLEDLSHVLLFTDEWVLIGNKGSGRLSTAPDYDSLCSMPYVATKPGGVPSVVERIFDHHANRPIPITCVPSFNLAIMSVVHSDCVTIVPSKMITEATRPLLDIMPPPFEIATLEEYLVWHSRNDLEPGHRWFREMLLTA